MELHLDSQSADKSAAEFLSYELYTVGLQKVYTKEVFLLYLNVQLYQAISNIESMHQELNSIYNTSSYIIFL